MATVEVVKAGAIHPVSNDAEEMIKAETPYNVEILIEGTTPILFHRWSVEGVQEKANSKKGSKAKKTDDTESYMYRTETGEIALPSEYLRMSLINAARFKQDPRSPRKSAMDLVKAGLCCLNELCTTGKRKEDFIDKRRVCVQRNGITRARPALFAGWRIRCEMCVLLPEYMSPQFVQDLAVAAGKLIGVGDFRPTYGRFCVMGFRVVQLEI
jgi:hypothetical protein